MAEKVEIKVTYTSEVCFKGDLASAKTLSVIAKTRLFDRKGEIISEEEFPNEVCLKVSFNSQDERRLWENYVETISLKDL